MHYKFIIREHSSVCLTQISASIHLLIAPGIPVQECDGLRESHNMLLLVFIGTSASFSDSRLCPATNTPDSMPHSIPV
uniref:Uncharacterized protein n=1 Tax=Arundo donax TaxID=35708 RepID=A0A0A9EWE0_ARUDO